MTELYQQWQKCQQILADNLTASAYQTWFAPIVPLSFRDGVLVLQVKSQFVAEYIEENYIEILSRAIFKVYGVSTRLQYRAMINQSANVGTNIPSPGAREQSLRKSSESVSSGQPTPHSSYNFDSQLNKSYNFDTFVAGEPNKLARTAGLAVAKQPGYTAFNPLFIYGGSGVGKTHLANAIGNQVRLLYPEKLVLYVSANTFKLQFQDAAATNHIPDFLNFYQGVDVLIMDDIQYLSGLTKTQDTFFHIFNYLQQAHKQLILTSDRSPMELPDIEDRLLTRFKWGLMAEIVAPDYQLRRDILLNKMQRDGLELSDEIVTFIATNVRDSVRDLEGILASLYAHASLTNREIDLQLAEQVVSRIVQLRPDNGVQIEDVMAAVARFYNVSEQHVKSPSRAREVALARHVTMYLSKQLTDRSLSDIGLAIGRRTHATVLHSCSYVRQQLETDPTLRQQIAQLETLLKN